MWSVIKAYVDELEDGEQIRVNHTSCPAGEDTKRRLYVKRTPQVVLGYCHNCGDSASVYIGDQENFRNASIIQMPEKFPNSPACYVKLCFDEEHVPADAHKWRVDAGLSVLECIENNIYFLPDPYGIRTPVINGTTDIGFQIRPLRKRGGKYSTHLRNHDAMGGILGKQGNNHKTLIIVEDVVSAVHVKRNGADAFVNYGVQIKPDLLYHLKGYERIVVWLDNDNATVVKASRDMVGILQLLHPTVDVQANNYLSDPKHCSDKDIKGWIK